MFSKMVKRIVLAGLGTVVVGAVLFGTELPSYFKSSLSSVQGAVKDAIPIEFQLQRAKDLVGEIVPEMQANIRAVAQQEVELANLKEDITQSTKSLEQEQVRIQKVRQCLSTSDASFTVNTIQYSRQQMTDELARRFDRFKEAEIVLAGKQRLLENRERGMQAALQMLERTRSQKAQLENQISALEGQFRLIQASATGSKLSMDTSKIAQTEKVISQIKTQLDVAERVLAHEARFTEPMRLDIADEKSVLAEVDERFNSGQAKVEPEPGKADLATTRSDEQAKSR